MNITYASINAMFGKKNMVYGEVNIMFFLANIVYQNIQSSLKDEGQP